MLKVTGLSKTFTTQEGDAKVVDDVSFEVSEAQCYVLLGPSGCGKTTTLRCVAGLEHADSGKIEIAGQVVSDTARGIFVPVHERSIGMVFQSYAIWPHFDVFENVAYPLRVQRPRLGEEEIETRVMDVLTLVGMESMARRPATRLSGGQQQRVALARAIVRKPAILLLDEPLSNLDARLRDNMRKELADLIARIRITALLVTHDQIEAFSLAHRIAVMNQGRIVQEGLPREIYRRPKDSFVARFLGAANILSGRIESRDAGSRAELLLDGSGQRIAVETDHGPGDRVELVLHPESLVISRSSLPPQGDVITGNLRSLVFLGGIVEYVVDLGAGSTLRVLARSDVEIAVGAPVWISIGPGQRAIFRSRASDAGGDELQ